MSTTRIPKLRHHKATGQGFVVLDGRYLYLGRYDDPATVQKYHHTLAEWAANGNRLPVPKEEITVAELAAAFVEHAREYYRHPDGTQTSQATVVEYVVRPWVDMFGTIPACEFGPLKLKVVQDHWIKQKLSRTTINKAVRIIRHVCKWGASRELIPPSVWHGLQCVPGLRAGRSEAREPEPVRPVPVEHIEAIKPHVSRQVAAMIDLQLLTGARSGEVVGLTPADIDTSSDPWVAVLDKHKTAHHGKERRLFFGPRAQTILKPFMLRPATAPLFSPQEAEAERYAACETHRHQPVPPAKTDRALGDCYTVASYRRAVAYACSKAGIPAWNPHRLRHTAATEIRQRFGLDAAQVVLGHSGADITEIYAEIDSEKARRVIAEIG